MFTFLFSSVSQRLWARISVSPLSLGALDASAEVTQLFIDALVATVDLLHIADCGDAISSERGQHQGHPGANIRAADMLAHQTARANHHGAMWVTEDNL